MLTRNYLELRPTQKNASNVWHRGTGKYISLPLEWFGNEIAKRHAKLSAASTERDQHKWMKRNEARLNQLGEFALWNGCSDEVFAGREEMWESWLERDVDLSIGKRKEE